MDLHRPISALLAMAYLAVAWFEAGAQAAGLLAIPLAVLVWLVWEADAAAGFTGQLGFTPLRRSSPAGMVRALAWVFLLLPLAAWVVSRMRPAP